MTDRTYTAFLWIVTTAWVANIAAGMLKINGYQPDPYINGIFMATVGAALIAKSRKQDKPKHRRPVATDDIPSIATSEQGVDP